MIFSLFILGSCRPKKNVVELTSKTWKRLINDRNDSTVWIVDFQGSYCPACRQIEPVFAEAAEKSNGMVKFGSLDTQKNNDIASRFNIRYIPTFIIFYPGGDKVYMGDRSVQGFCNAGAKYIPNKSHVIDDEWKGSTEKSVILFTNKASVPPMWAAISCYFEKNEKNIKIGHALSNSLKDEYNISAFPTVLAIDGETRRIFSGKPGFLAIRNFIEKFFEGTLPDAEPETEAQTSAKKPQKAKGPRIETIDKKDKFEKLCKAHKNCVVIAGNTTDSFITAANKYHSDPFIFGIAPLDGELSYVNSGIWIFHRTLTKVFKVQDIDMLPNALDRILDGSLRWEPFDRSNGQDL